MADINDEGSVRARCPGCKGALSTFEWRTATGIHGALTLEHSHRHWSGAVLDYRLYRCAGCGRGGLGVVA